MFAQVTINKNSAVAEMGAIDMGRKGGGVAVLLLRESWVPV